MWQFSADKNVPHLLQCDRDRQPSRAHRNSPDSHLLGHLARLPDDTWHQEKWRGETYFIWIFYQLSSPSPSLFLLSLKNSQSKPNYCARLPDDTWLREKRPDKTFFILSEYFKNALSVSMSDVSFAGVQLYLYRAGSSYKLNGCYEEKT